MVRGEGKEKGREILGKDGWKGGQSQGMLGVSLYEKVWENNLTLNYTGF